MDHWKKNLPFKSDNYKRRLISHGQPVGNLDSFYEIDIQSSFDFGDRKPKESRTLEGYRNKPLPKFQTENCETSSEEIRRNEFEKTFSEKKQSTPKPKFIPNSSEAKNEVSFMKEGKENQSPDGEAARKFKEYLKKRLIQNFISENDASMKSAFQNICDDSDKSNNQLHFHHHEHHHHYYVDDGLINNSQSRFYEEIRFPSNQEKSKKEKYTEEEPLNTYYVNCPSKTTYTYTKVDGILLGNHNFDAPNSEKSSKLEKTLKPSPAIFREKFSNNVETIYSKNANDFYDDTNEIIQTELEKEKLVLVVSNADNAIEGNLKAPSRNTPERQNSNNTTKIFEGNSGQHSNSRQNQNWEARLKRELKKIKKDLQRLEEKHKMKRLKNQIEIQKISVYSNKTFIIGKEQLVLQKKQQENLPGKNEEHRVEMNYNFVKPERLKEEEFFKKRFPPRDEYLYTNNVYMIRNKV